MLQYTHLRWRHFQSVKESWGAGGKAAALGMVITAFLLLAGCAGGETYTMDEVDIAQGYLPTTCRVPHHPDSLKAVKIVEKEHHLALELEHSYETLVRNWSTTWLSQSAQRVERDRRVQSFALLWSLDLSIAALRSEGIEGLTKDLARSRIEARRKEYQDEVQIDVYRFVQSPATRGGTSDTWIGGPGRRVILRDDQGHEYRPKRVDNGRLIDANAYGYSTLYRRNILYFERTVDGRDILENVDRLQLVVQESFAGDYYFSWAFTHLSP